MHDSIPPPPRGRRIRLARMVVLAGLAVAGFGLSSWCLAADQAPPDSENQALQERIDHLEQRLEEMQKEYMEQLRALMAEVAAMREGRISEGTPEPAPAAEEDAEVARLRLLAAAEAEAGGGEEAPAEEGNFEARGLNQQTLNPQLSITGDMNAFYRDQDGSRERSGFDFRVLGMHLESYLDPYSQFKASLEIDKNGVELGEAYMTLYGLPGSMSATFGKFRQQFGVVNRWHKHSLDQFDFPLALRQIFGEGGLNQTGVSLDWALPGAGKMSQGLTVQITDGENQRLFDGNTLGTPSLLLQYKNYRDLTPNTYLDVGLTGLLGWQDEWDVDRGAGLVTENDSRSTMVYGLDWSLVWEPTHRMRYRNVEWRGEFFFLDRGLLAPDGSGADTIQSWGAYTYVQSKLNRKFAVGTRLDYYTPDNKSYADLVPYIAPHAFTADTSQWLLAPYITWEQSPWVRWRVEYNHVDFGDVAETENVLYLQLIFAAGPHKHERY